MSLRNVLIAIVLFAPGAVQPHQAAAGLIGTSISADLQPFASAAVITQFTSPQTVIDPGTEFTGQFTPNAAGYPIAVQVINSFAMSVDISAIALRVTMSEVPGSITGFHNNFGPALRLNVTNIHFPSETLTGITQSAGPSPFAFSQTSPTSIAIDFDDFSARTMDFNLTTTAVPEPAATALAITMLTVVCTRRPRRGRKSSPFFSSPTGRG